ncbi:MAG: phospho-sugar mutase [Bacteroidales bacterium]|nr:phospho-sugar mutase [Bacteroidales bacterium]
MNTGKQVDPQILDRALRWTGPGFDEETAREVDRMIKEDPEGLTDAFYRDLEFGTGGLRGVMGAGTNRMNRYTVGMATQGLSNYLKKCFAGISEISVVIAYDSRRNNTFFAGITADVFSANGIRVYLFDDIRPTPELSFAIRHLGCQSGVVITASHNPPEYNGYKAYWEDGSQLIHPHDVNVIKEVKSIRSVEQVKWKRNIHRVTMIGDRMDMEYIGKLKTLSLSPGLIDRHKNIGIVYTPLHGTGTRLVPMALEAFGFRQVHTVKEQTIPDGSFPTVKSPNPEEPEALSMAIRMAHEVDASLVMATDPDADRLGIAVRNKSGDFELLNGNQTAVLLTYYLLLRHKELGRLTGNEFIVKTIVTTELIADIARHFGVEHFDTLTGFKFIAEIIRDLEGKKKFIGGGEESFGYLIGDDVRDKDAVVSCCFFAEMTAWAASRGKTVMDVLTEIYTQFGMYREKLYSLVRKGKKGAEEIGQIMDNYRKNPPTEINHSRVTTLIDYLTGESRDLAGNTVSPVNISRSNVLQFVLEDGSKISVRPSGTEPKIKYYFSVRDRLDDQSRITEVSQALDKRLEDIIRDLNLWGGYE